MAESNPYLPPKAQVADADQIGEADSATLNRVASGQRIVIYSILVAVAANALQISGQGIAGLVGIVGIVVAIFGVIRLTGGLGTSTVGRFFYAILMFIPLLNLVGMLVLSARATRVLRAAGYSVGLMGANQR